jgi:hypothetical protein
VFTLLAATSSASLCQALAAYVDSATPPDPTEVPDSDDDFAAMDPTADPTAVAAYAAAGAGGAGRSNVVPQRVVRRVPDAAAVAAAEVAAAEAAAAAAKAAADEAAARAAS